MPFNDFESINFFKKKYKCLNSAVCYYYLQTIAYIFTNKTDK